jgi:hypothetical protein
MSADPSGFPDGGNSRIYSPTPFSSCDPFGLQAVTLNEFYENTVTGYASYLAAGFTGGLGALASGLATLSITKNIPITSGVAALGGSLSFAAYIFAQADIFRNQQLAKIGQHSIEGSMIASIGTLYDYTVRPGDPASADLITGANSFSSDWGTFGVTFTAKITSTRSFNWVE